MSSNLTIGKQEIHFLRDKIMTRYASLVGYDVRQFERGLTGTISIYEKIEEVVGDYLEDESNVKRYMVFLKDSPLKLQLRKWAESGDVERKRYLRDWRSFLSASVLRKLLFYGRTESSQAYKEGVITAFYLYAHQDRQDFLQENPVPVAPERGGTIPPVRPPAEPEHGSTMPVFTQEKVFLLRRLQENNSIDPNRPTLVFDGESHVLNRGNVDPENLTITSKAQAEIVFVDGEWWLEDKSVMRTTFIQVNKRTKIAKGDIIVLGNRRFLF
ncbi:MAG TPA: FHA domain-containing protein, partial [Puia sp.]|nr:FHA domain-containing protein [Puia sp.]